MSDTYHIALWSIYQSMLSEKFILFQAYVIFCSVCILHFLYPSWHIDSDYFIFSCLLWMIMQKSLWCSCTFYILYNFTLLGYIWRNKIAWLWARSIFKILRNLYTIFLSIWTNHQSNNSAIDFLTLIIFILSYCILLMSHAD